MPNLTDPFPGMTPGKRLSTSETVRALRLDLTAEEDAIATYTAHAEATGNALVRKTLLSIADEERVHAGELQELIRRLAPEEEKHLQAGSREVAGEAKGAKKMGKLQKQESERWVTIQGKRIKLSSAGKQRRGWSEGRLQSSRTGYSPDAVGEAHGYRAYARSGGKTVDQQLKRAKERASRERGSVEGARHQHTEGYWSGYARGLEMAAKEKR